MGRKSDEKECLDQVLKIRNLSILRGDIIAFERPDFLIGSTGIEHFMIEECQNYEMTKGDISDTPVGSITREQRNQHAKYVQRFKQCPEELQSFIDRGEAKDYLEKAINKSINTISDFKYRDFIENFQRVIDKHIAQVNEYYKKCEELVFLIEIPYNRPLDPHAYIIFDHGKGRNQNVQSIPFTRDMIRILSMAPVDYIILYMHEVHFAPNRMNHCQVIFLDMTKNIEKQLRRQHIVICDKFDYALKFSNRDVIQFKTEK